MIRAQDLSKYYGAKRALGPVSFEIEDGETVGFLGLNGAGKTTALRIFACDLRPSSGRVVVGDIDAVQNPHEVRKRIGYLPENPPLYQDMQVEEFLHYAGKLRGMNKSELAKRTPEVLDATSLEEVRHELIRTLSQGYRQRVGVAQAIMHEPQLLILDEPTRGLDPVQIVDMRNLIQSLKRKHTVLVSSHILTEISETCDRLLVLGKGEIIATGTESDLANTMRGKDRLRVAVHPAEDSDPDKVLAELDALDIVEEARIRGIVDGATEFQVTTEKEARAEVSRALVEAGHDIIELAKDRRELENIFLKLVEKKEQQG